MEIVFFNELCIPERFEEYFPMIEEYEHCPCFTNNIKLKVNRGLYIPFNKKHYCANKLSTSFGTVYSFSDQYSPLFDVLKSNNVLKKDIIPITKIAVDSTDDLLKRNFTLIEKTSAVCYTANVKEKRIENMKGNRHIDINMSRFFLFYINYKNI